MEEAELDQVRERIEWSLARQREEYGDDETEWPWATVRDTTVQRLLIHLWNLELEVAELRGRQDQLAAATENDGPIWHLRQAVLRALPHLPADRARALRDALARVPWDEPLRDLTGPLHVTDDVFDRYRDLLEALAAERNLVGVRAGDDGALWVLPGMDHPLDRAALDDYAAAAGPVLGHRPQVRYSSWQPDGREESVPADPDRPGAYHHLATGAHDDSATCRACGTSLTLDHDAGTWRGRHWRLCPARPSSYDGT